jgi:hypothetical protein
MRDLAFGGELREDCRTKYAAIARPLIMDDRRRFNHADLSKDL